MQKYKVFLNGQRIEFAPYFNITFTSEKDVAGVIPDRDGLDSWLSEFEKSGRPVLQIEAGEVERIFKAFRDLFLQVDAAGGIVRKENRILFIYRNGKWDLPKGKIDEGETPEEAALREVSEECGISGHYIVKKCPSTYHIYRSPYPENKGCWIFKETYWFEMGYEGPETTVPQQEEGITQAKWLTPHCLGEVLENTYENLKELIASYLP